MKEEKSSLLARVLGLHNEPIFRRLRKTTIILILYSITIVIAQTYLDSVFDEMQISNLGQFHLIFSFIISILVGFRTNSSYQRWWEGRGFWGSLVNNERNLAFKFNNYIGLKNDKLFLECLVNFPLLLKHHQRRQQDKCIEIITGLGLEFHTDDNIPNIVANHMYSQINKYRVEGKITFEQFLSLETHMVSLIDIHGGCEKIINTPIPLPFKLFVQKALQFYMIIFPFGWVEEFGILIIPILIVLVYILKGLEILAEDMEDPFGENDGVLESNNLPLDTIAGNIAKNVYRIAELDR